jgi:hypothetical protein
MPNEICVLLIITHKQQDNAETSVANIGPPFWMRPKMANESPVILALATNRRLSLSSHEKCNFKLNTDAFQPMMFVVLD